jgi:hypothetical protein
MHATALTPTNYPASGKPYITIYMTIWILSTKRQRYIISVLISSYYDICLLILLHLCPHTSTQRRRGDTWHCQYLTGRSGWQRHPPKMLQASALMFSVVMILCRVFLVQRACPDTRRISTHTVMCVLYGPTTSGLIIRNRVWGLYGLYAYVLLET